MQTGIVESGFASGWPQMSGNGGGGGGQDSNSNSNNKRNTSNNAVGACFGGSEGSVVTVDADAVVLVPFSHETAWLESIPPACSCSYNSSDDCGDPICCWCCCYYGGGGGGGGGGSDSNSHSVQAARVVSAGVVEGSGVDCLNKCFPPQQLPPPAILPSTDETRKESFAAHMVVMSGTGGDASYDGNWSDPAAGVCVSPVDDDGGALLPDEARPPWELASAFKLVTCERVSPPPPPPPPPPPSAVTATSTSDLLLPRSRPGT